MKTLSSFLVAAALTVGVGIAHTEAMTVSQLNITGGTIAMSLNGTTYVPTAFSTTGTIVMGTYQPPPAVAPSFDILGNTIEFVTNPGPNPGNPLPAPSGLITGSTIAVDLQSLHANITGPIVPGGGSAFLNIGNQPPGMATGTYDPNTGAFSISWLHLYNGDPQWMKGIQVGLDGTANVATPPVPLPAAAWLFGTGVLSLPWVRRIASR